MLQAAMSRGALSGAMLALAAAAVSPANYDAASNSFLAANPSDTPNLGAVGAFTCDSALAAGMSNGSSVAYTINGNKYVATLTYPKSATDGGPASGYTNTGACMNYANGGAAHSYNWIALYYYPVSSFPPNGVPVAASNAQIESALQAPGALAKVWDAGGCPAKVTTFRDTLSADDPCAKIIGSPAGQWTPVTVPNGGAVSFPSTTQTITDGTGKVTGTITKTPTAQVTPNTNQSTMAASPVIVTGGSVVKTVTNNADGSQTTSTTTTTAPSTTTDQPQDGTATFNAGTQDLYTKKTRTWAQVLADFQTKLQQAPWYVSASSFFNVSISGGACPHWTVSATKWTPAMDAGVYVCSSSMMALYQTGGIVVMIVAAWAAFRIAFL